MVRGLVFQVRLLLANDVELVLHIGQRMVLVVEFGAGKGLLLGHEVFKRHFVGNEDLVLVHLVADLERRGQDHQPAHVRTEFRGGFLLGILLLGQFVDVGGDAAALACALVGLGDEGPRDLVLDGAIALAEKGQDLGPGRGGRQQGQAQGQGGKRAGEKTRGCHKLPECH